MNFINLITFLAILTAILHGLIVMFLLLGTILIIFNKFKRKSIFEKLYLFIAIISAISFIFSKRCFLTDIEKWFWKLANSRYTYTGGFAAHYIEKIGIHISDTTSSIILIVILIAGLSILMLKSLLEKLNKRS